ncbi:MAG TPA: twitching motility protein PilT [Roseiflexaceae bacterium]|nr:twitching motility protein PilT [Roseiflexaceae bacterium]
MNVSLNFIVRIIGMLGLAYVANMIGVALSGSTPSPEAVNATRLLTLAGAGLGLLTTPRLTLEPIQRGIRYIRRVSVAELTAISFGALIGLIFSVLLAIPLSYLPGVFGQVLPISIALGLAYLGAMIFSARKKEIGDLLRTMRPASLILPQPNTDVVIPQRYLLDTSAIIDGRIASVLQVGFIDGTLLVPHFVLQELQLLADSADDLRRNKGRRGLDILNSMQKQGPTPVEIVNVEIPGTPQVDEKLIVLARQYRCPIITNDHNLGRVAELQGVRVLNLNQLADAVRPPLVTGQSLTVNVRDIGREREQGIGFLEDGTMIVIEEARNLVGQDVTVVVTRVYQTQTGRIVFAQIHRPVNIAV